MRERSGHLLGLEGMFLNDMELLDATWFQNRALVDIESILGTMFSRYIVLKASWCKTT